MMNKYAVFLDAGHGGLDEAGRYRCIVPGKAYWHRQGGMHQDGMFFEGVFNRKLSDYVFERLKDERIPVLKVYHPVYDLPLWRRVAIANKAARDFNRSLFISNHANASPGHNARGWEVYTSPGKTAADEAAELLVMYTQSAVGRQVTMRYDLTDGDHDKEARFTVLMDTSMPALLPENLFFDQYDDACLLMDPDFMKALGEAQVAMIKSFLAGISK